MTNSLVLLIEVGLLALLLLLAFRMVTLIRTDPFVPAVPATGTPLVPQQSVEAAFPDQARQRIADTTGKPSPSRLDKCELITQLHILLSIQERDCRSKGLDLDTSSTTVKEYALAWLYGAACALCEKSQRHSDALLSLVSQLGSRKTGIRQPEAVQALSTLTGSSVLLVCFRHGVEGAEYWREHRYVPRESSLYDAITSNAFI